MASTSSSGAVSLLKPEPFKKGAQQLRDLFTHCHLNFVLNSHQFSTDQKKVYYLASFFQDTPLQWFSSLLEKEDPKLSSFSDFKEELSALFGADKEQSIVQAESKLRKLKQTRSASEYFTEFDALAALVGLDDTAKKFMVYGGLKTSVKQALARTTDTWDNYPELRESAILLDDRLFELSKEGNIYQHQGPKGKGKGRNQQSSRPFSSPPSSFAHQRKGPLTPDERQRRIDNSLCLYCGKAGHVSANCHRAKRNKNNKTQNA